MFKGRIPGRGGCPAPQPWCQSLTRERPLVRAQPCPCRKALEIRSLLLGSRRTRRADRGAKLGQGAIEGAIGSRQGRRPNPASRRLRSSTARSKSPARAASSVCAPRVICRLGSRSAGSPAKRIKDHTACFSTNRRVATGGTPRRCRTGSCARSERRSTSGRADHRRERRPRKTQRSADRRLVECSGISG